MTTETTQPLRARHLGSHLLLSHPTAGFPAPSPTSIPAARLSSLNPAARTRAAAAAAAAVSDDLLALLTPATALMALQAPPPGPLKQCLATAALSERELAFRAASASSRVMQWLDEVDLWPWPAAGGSAGFEQPEWARAGRVRRKTGKSVHPAGSRPNHADDVDDMDAGDGGGGAVYHGSLRDQDLIAIERRIGQIWDELEELGMEDIKSQVLHNHILPLSRPGSPLLAAGSGSGSGAGSYPKMGDMSAVITAIVVQTLPNLSRLCRNLTGWAARIAVLYDVPALLEALADAEAALRAGWNAISMVSNRKMDSAEQPLQQLQQKQQSDGDDNHEQQQKRWQHRQSQPDSAALSRRDLDVMRSVIEQKVAVPAGQLDGMLDRLAGLRDSLPEQWLDRMEAVETEFCEWVAAGQRIIREAEWARTAAETRNNTAPTHAAAALPPPPPLLLLSRSDAVTSDTSPMKIVAGQVITPIAASRIPTPPSTPGRDGAMLLPPIHIGARRAGNDDDEDDDEDDVDDDSSASDAVTVIHGATGGGGGGGANYDLASEPPQSPTRNSPSRLPRAVRTSGSPIRIGFGAASPPCLAPAITESFLALPGTPLDHPSFPEEDEEDPASPGDPAGRKGDDEHGKRSDDQLRRQIRDILQSIPGRFKLSSEPATPGNGTGGSSGSSHLNPPDLVLPRLRRPSASSAPPRESRLRRSTSSLSTSRAPTPLYTLTPAPRGKDGSRRRPFRGQQNRQETRIYHLSHSSGGAPIKLFIRAVGEHGERVMVRVGGGWADLGEYLKEYAAHHGRRSGPTGTEKVEIRDLPAAASSPSAGSSTPSGEGARAGHTIGSGNNIGSSPPRPGSSSAAATATAHGSPITPLLVRKKRRGSALDHAAALTTPLAKTTRPGTPVCVTAEEDEDDAAAAAAASPPPQPGSNSASASPMTPANAVPARQRLPDGSGNGDTSPSTGASTAVPSRSRPGSRPGSRLGGGGIGGIGVGHDGSMLVPPTPSSIALGMAGPRGKKYEMSEESRAWVESVKERVRQASGERRVVSGGGNGGGVAATRGDEFGELGRAGGTKRVFRRA